MTDHLEKAKGMFKQSDENAEWIGECMAHAFIAIAEELRAIRTKMGLSGKTGPP